MWRGRGRPGEARRLLEAALEEAAQQAAPLSSVGDLHVALADVLCERGDLDAATEHLDRARELGDLASLPENRHRWWTTAAAVRRAEGDLDGALEMLDRAAPLYQRGFFPDLRPIGAQRARVLIAAGELAAGEEWAADEGVAVAAEPAYLDEYAQLTLARLRIAQWREGAGRDPADVFDMLHRIVDAAEAAGRGGSVVEGRLVRALAQDAAGARGAALGDLSAALVAGVPAGCRRVFLDEGPPLERLLEWLVRERPDDPAVAHAALLLSSAGPPRRRTPAGEEPLSDRELEVLRLLATDLTGPEIARRLFVSVNTLRTHTKHIFTKLGVNTRRAAVSRATEQRLL